MWNPDGIGDERTDDQVRANISRLETQLGGADKALFDISHGLRDYERRLAQAMRPSPYPYPD